MKCFYFGCWNEAGHFLFAPGGRSAFQVVGRETDRIEHYGNRRHLDGTLAPRVEHRTKRIVWNGMDDTRIEYRSEECPQGQFLLHHLDNGYTAIQWWDRCQGDTRGACNSTVLLEGEHTSPVMLAALREYFPHVLENLERGSPDIEQMRRRHNEYWRPPENQGRVQLVEVFKP